MARVYDLEQLIEPTLLGCDKARISIEVNILFTIRFPSRAKIMKFLRVFAFVMINLLSLQMNPLGILFN